MLIFVGPKRQLYNISHGKKRGDLPAVRGCTYDWLFRTLWLPAATYVFLGIDRLDQGERRLAGAFYRHINGLGPGFRALNDPARAMGRFDFLRAMHRAGINRFNAYLASEQVEPAQFPVFIRRNAMHTPILSGLIETPQALAAELDRLISAGEPPTDLIIIEYAPDEFRPGAFRKMGAFRMADDFFPFANMYEPNWIIDRGAAQVAGPDDHAAEAVHLRDFALRPQIERAFQIAGIEYGRADFGLRDGQAQFFEINFNPFLSRLINDKTDPNPVRRANLKWVEERVARGLNDLDTNGRGLARTLHTEELWRHRLSPGRNYAPQRY